MNKYSTTKQAEMRDRWQAIAPPAKSATVTFAVVGGCYLLSMHWYPSLLLAILAAVADFRLDMHDRELQLYTEVRQSMIETLQVLVQRSQDLTAIASVLARAVYDAAQNTDKDGA